MSDRFIKFIPSEESEWLLENQPNAYLLLNLIAIRARRISGNPDGLEIGEALIGDFNKCGLKTRGQYRHALSILETRAHIKISENCRTRKKATTGTTTIGTKVKLLRSDVWDLNLKVNNHRNDHPTTTEQPPNNHEQERNKKVKKEEEQQPQTPVVVFSCLEKIDDSKVSREEKITITKAYHSEEQRIIDAVNSILSPDFTPRETLLMSLRAAIKQQWKPNGASPEDYQKNKDLCRKLDMRVVGNNSFMASPDYLEIIRGPIVEIIKYNMTSGNFLREVEKKAQMKLDQIFNEKIYKIQ